MFLVSSDKTFNLNLFRWKIECMGPEGDTVQKQLNEGFEVRSPGRVSVHRLYLSSPSPGLSAFLCVSFTVRHPLPVPWEGARGQFQMRSCDIDNLGAQGTSAH